MITMEEVNQALRKTWTEELKKEESLPITLAKGYKSWVQQRIKGAVEGLQKDEDPASGIQEAGASGDEQAQQE